MKNTNSIIFSLRLGGQMHNDQEYIDSLLNLLEESGKCIDEVWIATSYGLLSVEECKENAKMMGITAEKFEKSGIVASMQVSRTIGHGDALLKIFGGDGVKNLDVDMVTNIDGEKSVAQFCWNNENFRKYISESLKAYSSFKPKFVWVDDDLRIRAIGKSRAFCFCDNCVRLFNEKYGYNYTREALKNHILFDLKIRKEYIDFQTESLGDFAKVISSAVHSVSPDSVMSLQNGGNTMLAINSQKTCLDMMKSVTGKSPAFRAGGGFYDDHTPYNMIDKALQLNYINSRLPEYVKMRSCEIENLPYVAYGKSNECTCIEATIYMAYGCNMASVTLMSEDEPLSYHKELFSKIAIYKPFLHEYVKLNMGTKNSGITIYQPKNSHLVYYSKDDSAAWNDTSIWEFRQLARCGIPFNTEPESDVYALSYKACRYISDEDMEFLLKQPVITDAASIEKLCGMGYADSFSATVKKIPCQYQGATYERTCKHTINSGIDMKTWSDSRYYAHDEAYSICGADIERISEFYSSETGEKLGCATAIIKTKYGAKWFVKGIALQNGVISYKRRNQMINAVEYIKNGMALNFVASPTQTVIIPRVNSEGKTVSLTLLNVSITDSENVEICIANPANKNKCTVSDPYDGNKSVAIECRNGRYYVNIGKIPPWRVKNVFIK